MLRKKLSNTQPQTENLPPPHLEKEIERGYRILRKAALDRYEEEACRLAYEEERNTPDLIEPTFTWQECVEASAAHPPKKQHPRSTFNATLPASDTPRVISATPSLDPAEWVPTSAFLASSHEPDLITIRLGPLIGTAVDRAEVLYGKGLTLTVYVPKKRIPWEMRVRVNRQNLSRCATIFWSPSLPTPQLGESVTIWIKRIGIELPPELPHQRHLIPSQG